MRIGNLLLYIIITAIFIPSYLFGQWLNGTVTNAAGTPLPGAVLYFENCELDTTTDVNGKYQFDSLYASIKYFTSKTGIHHPVITGNIFSFSVSPGTPIVSLSLFSLSGKCIRTILDRYMAPGRYSISLSDGLPPATYIILLKRGNDSFAVRHLITGQEVSRSGRDRTICITDNNDIQTFLKKNAGGSPDTVIDVLICQAEGYERKYTPIISYKGTVDFILEIIDTIPPVVKFYEGEDTVSVQYDDNVALEYWFDDQNIRVIATDNLDPDPELLPPTNTLIDKSKPGFALIRHGARDDSHNVGYANRFLILHDTTVTDSIPPVIELSPDTVIITQGEVYRDSGVTAVDGIDGVLTGFLNITGLDEVNTAVPGSYTITYRSIDTKRNLAEAERIVIVLENTESQS